MKITEEKQNRLYIVELLSGKRITRNRKDLVRTNEGFKERSIETDLNL